MTYSKYMSLYTTSYNVSSLIPARMHTLTLSSTAPAPACTTRRSHSAQAGQPART